MLEVKTKNIYSYKMSIGEENKQKVRRREKEA